MFKHFIFFSFIFVCTVLILSCQDSTISALSSEGNQNSGISLSKAIVNDYEEIEFYDLILSGECLGEDLHFYGTLKKKVHTVINPNGNYHSFIKWVPLDMTVTGVTSGGTWRMLYAEIEVQHVATVGMTYQYPGHGIYIANQPGPNLMEHWLVHLTVNANGEVTAIKETLRIECHGN